jgi:protoporphyrinogen oxidase
MNKRIAILGAGITGLTAARLLKDTHEVTVFEKNTCPGGIARVKMHNDIPYHMVGGHCFNTKHEEVKSFVFNNVLKEQEWNHVQRKAKIFFHENFIDYPIEFSIKQIAQFDKDLAFQITNDFFISQKEKKSENLEEFFRNKFGDKLAEEYFIPYNRKIWNEDPKNMDPNWVESKLPKPDLQQFFNGLINNEKDSMPHSSFYYPKSNTQNTLIDNLAESLNIKCDFEIKSISKENGKWILNDNLEFDHIISTVPLDILVLNLLNSPANIRSLAQKLRYNKITNMLWETKDVDRTWTYHPSKDSLFHRHIHIGNFITPKRNYTITETVGEYSYEEMLEAGKKFDYLLKPIGHNISDHAYVIFDENYTESVDGIKEYLKEIGLDSIGRFGEWEYYNMDICMKSAMNLSKSILDKDRL